MPKRYLQVKSLTSTDGNGYWDRYLTIPNRLGTCGKEDRIA